MRKRKFDPSAFKTRYADISFGEYFESNGYLFIKVDKEQAVRLNDGEIVRFASDMLVLPAKTEISYEICGLGSRSHQVNHK